MCLTNINTVREVLLLPNFPNEENEDLEGK